MKQAKLFGGDEPKVLASLELEKAQTLVEQVKVIINPLCDRLQVVGSVRRKKASVGDLDFVVMATDNNWAKISQALKRVSLICAGKSVIKLNFPSENWLFSMRFLQSYRADVWHSNAYSHGFCKP